MSRITDLLVLGAGPAGLTAGLYGARAGLKTVVLETKSPGGQILLTDHIFNYPGFPDGITGRELAHLFQRQAEKYGCQIATRVGSVSLSSSDTDHRVSTLKETYESKTVIVATGGAPRRLNAPGEKKLSGAGISYCAVCDANFFEGLDVIVVGGGDSALEEAAYLSRICNHVFVIHRRDTFRGNEACQCLIRGRSNISTCMGTVVKEFQGDDVLASVRLAKTDGSKEWDLEVSGAFIYVGHTPNTSFLPDTIARDADGWIITDENMKSSVPGVYAAGDVRRKMVKQVSTAVGDGAQAAMAAEKYLLMQSCPV
jgi:thioredoxin reductase (NADPH)